MENDDVEFNHLSRGGDSQLAHLGFSAKTEFSRSRWSLVEKSSDRGAQVKAAREGALFSGTEGLSSWTCSRVHRSLQPSCPRGLP